MSYLWPAGYGLAGGMLLANPVELRTAELFSQPRAPLVKYNDVLIVGIALRRPKLAAAAFERLDHRRLLSNKAGDQRKKYINLSPWLLFVVIIT